MAFSVPERVFDWARRTPDKIAIVANGEPYSYEAFAACIARARGYFARQGHVGAGVAVLAIDSLLDFWTVSLALRSLGLTTIGVSSTAAMGELGLRDPRMVVGIAGRARHDLDAGCAALGVPLVLMPPEGDAPLAIDASAPPTRPGGHILQTSGTTGVYKKVLMDPAFESQYLLQRRDVSGVGEHSIVNTFHLGPWTGGGYKSAALVWMLGATLVVEQRPEAFLALRYPGITLSLMVPALLSAVLAAPEGAFPRSETMWVSVTGGTITQAQIDAAKACITPHIFNGLGATETPVIGFTALDTPEDHRWHRLAPGAAIEVVDENDVPAPPGEVGRLRVSTAGGPTGYMDDEEATRTFFKNGFFSTGDLAIIRADGRMALQGRVTEVLNIAGDKVLPAPIEDRLREALGVAGVCLFSMQDEAGEEGIHVIVETAAPLAVDRLTIALSAELRGFPNARVHFTPALPRNAAGKVLRLAAREQALKAMRANI